MCNLCICKCRLAFSKNSSFKNENKIVESQLSSSMDKCDDFESEMCIDHKNKRNENCILDERNESKHTLFQRLLIISLVDHVDSLYYIAKAFYCCEENLCFTRLSKTFVQQCIEKIIKKHHKEFLQIHFGKNLSLQARVEHLFDSKGNIVIETPTPIAVSTPMLIRKIPSISRISSENREEIKNIKRKLIF
jgi:hypothetical protein